MSDILSVLIGEHSLWDGKGWIKAQDLRGTAQWISQQCSPKTAVISALKNQGHFCALLTAAVVSDIYLIFTSNPQVSNLRNCYGRVDLITDDHKETNQFGYDRLLIVDKFQKPIYDPLGSIPEPTQPLFTAYTSGSTGTSKAFPKTWATIIAESDIINQNLQLGEHASHLISTVPPCHMFGFSYGLFGPLRWGMSLDTRRPVFPKDLAATIASSPGPAWVVTTPSHLTAYVRSQISFEGLAGFVCSAAQLPLALAQEVKKRFGKPIIETYGCTEAGAIAWRNPTADEPWQCYQGIDLIVDGKASVQAQHLPPNGHVLDDEIELLDNGYFRIIGRSSEQVKIAGKRACLSDLNQRLCSLPGVVDGTFHRLDTSFTSRGDHLIAFVVSIEPDRETLIRGLRSLMDPVFLPKPLILVPQLPRTESGKLTKADLDAMLHFHNTQKK